MTLLDFARGPALETALAIFAFGVLWRLAALLFLPWPRERSVPRRSAPAILVGAAQSFVRHFWPRQPYLAATLFATLNSYVFHVGLAVVVFGMEQHILFLRSLFGVSWPNLPGAFITLAAILTLASLGAALVRRLTHPVLRLISTFDDYLSWLMTFLPVLSGLVAVNHLWLSYERLLALHILSVAAFLIWFPFGKLMHAFLVFLTRSETGIFYSRRGSVI